MISLLAMYWPALFIVAHIPMPKAVRQAGISDKTLHFLAYLGLVFLLWGALRPCQKVDWRKAAAWWVLGAAACYGAADEWLQGLWGGRTPDPRDFLADMAGAVTSLTLLSVLDLWLAGAVATAVGLFMLSCLTQADLTHVLPFSNAVLHFLGYGLFTALYLQTRSQRQQASRHRRWAGGLYALIAPLALLAWVKLMAWTVGKRPSLPEVIAALGGILVALATFSLLTQGRRHPPGPASA